MTTSTPFFAIVLLIVVAASPVRAEGSPSTNAVQRMKIGAGAIEEVLSDDVCRVVGIAEARRGSPTLVSRVCQREGGLAEQRGFLLPKSRAFVFSELVLWEGGFEYGVRECEGKLDREHVPSSVAELKSDEMAGCAMATINMQRFMSRGQPYGLESPDLEGLFSTYVSPVWRPASYPKGREWDGVPVLVDDKGTFAVVSHWPHGDWVPSRAYSSNVSVAYRLPSLKRVPFSSTFFVRRLVGDKLAISIAGGSFDCHQKRLADLENCPAWTTGEGEEAGGSTPITWRSDLLITLDEKVIEHGAIVHHFGPHPRAVTSTREPCCHEKGGSCNVPTGWFAYDAKRCTRATPSSARTP